MKKRDESVKGKESGREVFVYQAEVLKNLSNPKRLEIIYALKDGERSVGALTDILEIPKTNVSQHLAILKRSKLLYSRREGTTVYYAIANSKLIDACTIMRGLMIEHLEGEEALAKEFKRIG